MRARRTAALVAGMLVPAIAACGSEDVTGGPVTPNGFALAYGIWQPGSHDICSAAIHDAYSVVGPDGKLYPTWHPPVDPETGCTFGHEHGRDPRGSNLYGRVGDIPFGYANEALVAFDPLRERHEDHVGHKIEWENGVRLHFGGGGSAVLDVRCDVLVKLHQGSHSKDAFTNNLHELAYHIRCNDGATMHVTVMAAIGNPGEMFASCDDDRVIAVGPATPASSPAGGGKRRIPDRVCVERHMFAPPAERANFNAALRETWQLSQSIRRADGPRLARFDPYFRVFRPSRFYDPTATGLVGRPIDVCYVLRADGARANGPECERSTGNGTITAVAFDDPRSEFNGVSREMDINANVITNAAGPEVWYTDPFGHGGRTEPFPGSIRQFIARIDNSARDGHGPNIGRDRDYGGPGVRSPN